MGFEDFLDMFSVFSENADVEVKVSHLFRILDHDGDGYLDKTDLVSVLNAITYSEMRDQEREVVTDRVLDECDMDGDSRLSFIEFEHVLKRSSDFVSTFCIPLLPV